MKAVLAVRPLPSVVVSVMVALPVWPAAGVIVTVRLLDVPPSRTVGVSTGSDETAATARLPLLVTPSETMKLRGPIFWPTATT